MAARHGWSLDFLSIFELVPPEASLDPEREQTLFHPAELELSETSKLIFDRIAELNHCVSCLIACLKCGCSRRIRYATAAKLLALKHFFLGRNCTVVLLDDLSSSTNDLQLHSIAHGVILLEQIALDYGAERRRLRVIKMRGTKFRGGYHDFTIQTGGIAIYPRLVASEHHKAFVGDLAKSGV